MDPATNRDSVLLPPDASARLQAQPEGEAGSTAGTAPNLPLRIRVRELPLPEDGAAAAARYCRQYGVATRRGKQAVLDELLLQCHFGGQYVAYLRSSGGPVV